ncbi:hypothetical protein LUZ62_074421 [Rhynchospora pubera]|uniref:SHSP domain-containing protein n=1 Tax=Rhynchospora pubera TaxID=906938 RepID=A0AAV8D982_9POAL|nr:hypothetical protein LUZ62_074421 [Rhynchospora pubera]
MADLFLASPFRRFLWGPTVLREWQGSSVGALDWVETPSSHLLKFNVPGTILHNPFYEPKKNVPGYGKNQIKIQLEEDNVLSIRGEGFGGKEEQLPKDSVWHVSERGKGEFARQIVLPESVRADQIKAQVENGVLTIVLPKEPAPAKPKTRAIPVSSKL